MSNTRVRRNSSSRRLVTAGGGSNSEWRTHCCMGWLVMIFKVVLIIMMLIHVVLLILSLVDQLRHQDEKIVQAGSETQFYVNIGSLVALILIEMITIASVAIESLTGVLVGVTLMVAVLVWLIHFKTQVKLEYQITLDQVSFHFLCIEVLLLLCYAVLIGFLYCS